MSVGDGFVVGTTKIVDHGPATARWNMVLLGDGYRSSELTRYHADVQTFIDKLYSTAPFSSLWCGINIYRVDVASNESGAGDPGTCGDHSTGSGATPHTYFDATFCSDGNARRLLSCNNTLALDTSQAALPQVNMTMVIVNTSEYGGSGGSIATFSTASNAAEIGIHEMGHTAFSFADEYEYYLGCGVDTDRDQHPAGEPSQPNVTLNTNRATIKWGSLIAAATALPTTSNPNCSNCDTQSNPVSATTVGAFEGAHYYHCGCFRPQYTCRMRALSNPFCAVCSQVITNTLLPYSPPEIITLTTPSIAFTNIAEGIGGTGVTNYRAVVFEVSTCRHLDFRITSGPTGGFGTPFGASAPLDPPKYTAVGEARVWLSYTSTHAGDHASGSVTIHCDQTGADYVIPIVANTVARPKSAVTFVFDHSGSMSEEAGDGTTKLQKLREAANIFVSTMLQGDGIGIVRFDDTAQILMPVTDVGPPIIGGGRATATGFINGPQLEPAGSTSIGAGVLQGKLNLDAAQALGTPHYDTTAVVVLTDGEENTAPFLADVSSSITANTFAVGLGIPANISVPALTALTAGHNGYLLVTGILTPDQSARLAKYFLQILAGVTNADVVVDPTGYLTDGGEQKVPFFLNEGDMGADIILLTPFVYLVDFQVETPDGRRITSSSVGTTVQFVTSAGLSYYRMSLPAIAADPNGSHAGTWNAVLKLRRRIASVSSFVSNQQSVGQAVPYNVVVHAYSNLKFRAHAHQNSFEPGAAVSIDASLRQYDYPLEGLASVRADITRPDNSVFTLPLKESPGGQFDAQFVTAQSGLYTMRVRANGYSLRGVPFTREQTLSAAVYPGGNRPPKSGGGGLDGQKLCSLLSCLSGAKVIDEKLVSLLREHGFHIEAFRECLAAFCRSLQISEATRQATQTAVTPTANPLTQIFADPQVQTAILEMLSRFSPDDIAK